MKFHLSLNVSDIGRSVAFYEKVFGIPAAKHRDDYAKFEVTDPPLVLSLEPSPPAGRGSLNHVGLRLSDSAALVEMQRRLELAGLRSEREEGVECCYAKQTKFWLHSPDGVLWEFYVVQGDLGHRGVGQVPEAIPGATSNGRPEDHHHDHSIPQTAPVAADRGESWEHMMTQPFPERLAFEDASLTEIRLRGTFNTPEAEARRADVLAETKRVLVPGGRIALHLLTADRPLASAPSLPGPASLVKEVPTDSDLLASLERAGFVGVRLTKFGPNPCFRLGGAEMRETMIEAFVPPVDAGRGILVIYRGPFRELIDDSGRVFRRGERVRIAEADWNRIAASSTVDSFTRLGEPDTVVLACGIT